MAYVPQAAHNSCDRNLEAVKFFSNEQTQTIGVHKPSLGEQIQGSMLLFRSRGRIRGCAQIVVG